MILGMAIGINQGFHGGNSPSTTQLVLVLDGDVGTFDNPADSSTAGFEVFLAFPLPGAEVCMNVVSTVNESSASKA